AGVHVRGAVELQAAAFLAGGPRRAAHQRGVRRVVTARAVGRGRARALAERVVVDAGQAGRARPRLLAGVAGTVRAVDDLLVDRAHLREVHLLHLTVVGEEAVHLVFDVGDLRVHSTGDAALLRRGEHVALVLHVAPGERGRVRRHLVGVPFAEPHVAFHLEPEAAVLAVDGHPVRLRGHPGRADI